MDFTYTDEEINYISGYCNALLYYRACHDLGFTLSDDVNYYVDFSGYGFSGGYYQPEDCSEILLSILSPFTGEEGSVSSYDGSTKEEIQYYVSKGLTSPFDIIDSEEYDPPDGCFVTLAHPMFLDYLSRCPDGILHERIIKELDGLYVTLKEAIYYMDEAALKDEENLHLYSFDKEGFYFFIPNDVITCSEEIQSVMLDIANIISGELKGGRNEKH